VVHRQFREKFMPTQFGAKSSAVCPARGKLFSQKTGVLALAFASAFALGGCMPVTVPLAGADPADPYVKVADVRYRSTVAPYTRLRPVAPAGWREQNQSVAPAPKPTE
jgi:hypothetical protein